MDHDTRALVRASQEAPDDAQAAHRAALALARGGDPEALGRAGIGRTYLPPVHTSAETALVQSGYPYGFRGRCLRRVWIETKPRHGQRLMAQTSAPYYPESGDVAPDPARARWNKTPRQTPEQQSKIIAALTANEHAEATGAPVPFPSLGTTSRPPESEARS